MTSAPASTTMLTGAAGRVQSRALLASQKSWLRGETDNFDGGGARGGRSGGRRDGLDSTWVNVAVRRVAEEAGYMPWRLLTDDDELVEDGPLYDLLMVAPNREQDPRAFVESLVIELLTSRRGSVVIIKDFGLERLLNRPANDYSRLLPRELFVAESSRFRAVWTAGSIHPRIDHYEYTVPGEGGFGAPGGGIIKFAPEEVVVIGLSRGAERLAAIDGLPMAAAGAEAQQLDREMQRFAADYFRHDAAPGTVLTTEQSLTHRQIARMRRDWDERHRGRSWRTAVLHRGTALATTAPVKDTSMPELAKQVRERILALYGVPPIVAGIVDDANRSNSDAQTAFFILGAVASVCDRIDGALTRGLVAAHAWPAAKPTGARMVTSTHRREATRTSRVAARRIAERNASLMRAVDRLPDGARKRAAFSPLEGAPATSMSLMHDVDTHPSVARMKLESLTTAMLLVANGQPLNDVLDMLDLQVERRPEGDVSRIPFSLAPASSVDSFDAPEEDDPEEVEVEVEVDEETDDQGRAVRPRGRTLVRRTRRGKARSKPTAEPTQRGAGVCAPPAPAAAVSARTGEGRATPAPKCGGAGKFDPGALAREYPDLEPCCDCERGGGGEVRGIVQRHRATVAPVARAMESALRKHLRAQRDALLARVRSKVKPGEVDDAPGGSPATTRAAISAADLEALVYDLRVERGKIVAAARPALRSAALLGAAQGYAEAGAPGGLSAAKQAASVLLDDPNIRIALDQVGARLRLIEGRRLQEVKAVIRDAFDDPAKSFDDLVRGLKRYYDGEFTAARRAALTESAGVLNTARHESMRSEGVDGKLWLTASGKPRASHARAQADYGQTPIPIDQPFVVGGARLRFPGDPDAPAGERINCYCVQLAAFLDEGDTGPGGRSARIADLRFMTIQDVETA